ncbi:MAG: helix-turn-helix domain-containing protein, partial [Rhodospirillaceae bacterium]
AYDWPGNVRQLQNVVRNIVVLNDGPIVELGMLPEPLKSRIADGDLDNARPVPSSAGASVSPSAGASVVLAGAGNRGGGADAEIRPLWLVEKELIQQALRVCDDDVPKAAMLLEISPSTIYRKLQLWKAAGNR